MKSLQQCVDDVLAEKQPKKEHLKEILENDQIDIFELTSAVYKIRKKYFKKDILLHVINNVQNGLCPEDCHYCAQSKTSTTPIEKYPAKSEKEILKEAEKAHKSGAYRYCMVLSGRSPSHNTVDYMCDMIKKVKDSYPLEVCLSAGFLDQEKAQKLKKAGLDRLNHNLNTAKDRYGQVCTTHTYDDRVATLKAAQRSGIQLCSGVIVGMGESYDDVLQCAEEVNRLEVDSIPINFFIPVPGNTLAYKVPLTPSYCLRILAIFRLLNPQKELRVAAGRELHLRTIQPLAFMIANSLFVEGYLNTRGSNVAKTYQMLKDAGYCIKVNGDKSWLPATEESFVNMQDVALKRKEDLRKFEQESINIH